MIVTHIIRVRIVEMMVPLATLALSVLRLNAKKEDRAANPAEPEHSKRNTVAGGILRFLSVEEYVGSNNAA